MKRDRDETTKNKLEEKPAKRARTESQGYDSKLTHTDLTLFNTLHTDTAHGVQTDLDKGEMNREHIQALFPNHQRRNNRHRLRQHLYSCLAAKRVPCNVTCFDNVVNLSSYQLSVDELNLLSKGLTFIPYTPLTALCTKEDISCFVRKLRLRYKYRDIAVTHSCFKHKSKYIPGPTDYKPLENLISRYN